MPELLRRTARLVLAAVAVLAVIAPGAADAQITLMESGYVVTDLGSSTGAKGVECSPGGVWGDYIYIADSVGDVVERVDYFDILSLFATLDSNAFPVGLAFGPGPGANFGDFLYVTNYTLNKIVKITPAGVVSNFTAITAPADAVFDPSGAYGTDMFVAQAYSGPIFKVDDTGTFVPWSATPSLYMGFGPGGAWGTGMYATSQSTVGIVTIDPAGVPTDFCSGFTNPEGFDWAFGTGFDGDMFVPDVTTNEIWRVMSDGTRTLWATLPSAADVAFCNGSLYTVSFHTGECYKITPEEPVAVAFTDVEAHTLERGVRVTWDVFADEEMLGFIVYRELAAGGSEPARASLLLDSGRRAYDDEDVVPGASYRYTVAAQLPDGREIRSNPIRVSIAVAPTRMAQNYPNPFNPSTTIEYTLGEAQDVTLAVYDSKGRLVVDLENGARPFGTHRVTWDGLDAGGAPVASGIYFYRLTAGKQTLTRKLVLLK